MNSWLEIRTLTDTPHLSRRVAEGLLWREIVRERLGADTAIAYNKNGAPVLGDGRGYVSVSHTRGRVAVLWSPGPCSIDIELRDRPLPRAAVERYSITSMEEWCALEALYKYEGLTGIAAEPSRVVFLPHPELIVAVIR